MPKSIFGRVLMACAYAGLGFGTYLLTVFLDHRADSYDSASAPALTCMKVFNGLTENCPGSTSAIALHWEGLGLFGLAVATPLVFVGLTAVLIVKTWIPKDPSTPLGNKVGTAARVTCN